MINLILSLFLVALFNTIAAMEDSAQTSSKVVDQDKACFYTAHQIVTADYIRTTLPVFVQENTYILILETLNTQLSSLYRYFKKQTNYPHSPPLIKYKELLKIIPTMRTFYEEGIKQTSSEMQKSFLEHHAGDLSIEKQHAIAKQFAFYLYDSDNQNNKKCNTLDLIDTVCNVHFNKKWNEYYTAVATALLIFPLKSKKYFYPSICNYFKEEPFKLTFPIAIMPFTLAALSLVCSWDLQLQRIQLQQEPIFPFLSLNRLTLEKAKRALFIYAYNDPVSLIPQLPRELAHFILNFDPVSSPFHKYIISMAAEPSSTIHLIEKLGKIGNDYCGNLPPFLSLAEVLQLT